MLSYTKHDFDSKGNLRTKGRFRDKRKFTKSGKLKPKYSKKIYKEYIKSESYIKKRGELKKNACELCGSAYKLTLHHIDYGFLTNENENAVATLCWDCHQTCHFEIHNGKKRKLKKPSRAISRLIMRKRKNLKPKGHTSYWQRLIYIKTGRIVKANLRVIRKQTGYEKWRRLFQLYKANA